MLPPECCGRSELVASATNSLFPRIRVRMHAILAWLLLAPLAACGSGEYGACQRVQSGSPQGCVVADDSGLVYVFSRGETFGIAGGGAAAAGVVAYLPHPAMKGVAAAATVIASQATLALSLGECLAIQPSMPFLVSHSCVQD